MKKQIGFLLVMLVMLLTVSAAMADNVRTSGLYTYEVKGNGTIIITDFDWAENDGDVYIPNMIDGYTVTGIGNGAFTASSKKDTYFPNCSITLPESIKSIGNFAFKYANISAINIPANVQMIGYGAFIGNPHCQFKLAPNHPYFAVIDGGLYNKSKKELISYPLRERKPKMTSERIELTIPEGILSIGDYAFYEEDDDFTYRYFCIAFPSTLKTIGSHAFEGAYLYGNFPEMVASIGDYAFSKTHWEPYEGIRIQLNNIASIGVGAFKRMSSGYPKLYITIPESAPIKKIEAHTFEECELKSLSIHTPLEYIGDSAFSYIKVENGLSITDSTNISYIGKNVFLNHRTKLVFSFPALVDTIPSGYEVNMEIPSTVKNIESAAFNLVTDLKLPSTLENIDTNAFKTGSTFIVESGSYAELWCSENGFGYSIEGQDNLDWLNN